MLSTRGVYCRRCSFPVKWLLNIILNFHGVGPVMRSIDDGERNCWLEKDTFEAVLDLVQGKRHVRLTFDDGNISDVEIALPALLRRGLRASFFICSGRLDQPSFLTPAQVCELQARGMSIGSHGVAHISWRHLSLSRLQDELESSRRVLEKVCGTAINAAACPFGAYDRAVLSGLRRAGYRYAYTSDGGASVENHWLQARTTVTRSTTLDHLELLLQRGFATWNQVLIDIRKLIKRFR